MTHEEVPDMSKSARSLCKKKIIKRQAKSMGHVFKTHSPENSVTTKKMVGKRAKGRPRQKMTDDITNWLGTGMTTQIAGKICTRTQKI